MARAILPYEPLLHRSRLVIGAALILMSGLAWLYLGSIVNGMATDTDLARLGPGMGLFSEVDSLSDLLSRCLAAGRDLASQFGMPAMVNPWGIGDVAVVTAMWGVMVLAMMLPTAAPAILVFADIQSNQDDESVMMAHVAAFTGGYLGVWFVFALVAGIVQWGLHEAALLTPMMVSATPWLTGGLLIVAGLYQFSALKQACLTACRNPMAFFLQHWRDDRGGALRMGVHHGLFCLGCCWATMALMFAFGVMNLMWMAILGILMLLEKVLTEGRAFSNSMGVIFAGLGLVMLITELI